MQDDGLPPPTASGGKTARDVGKKVARGILWTSVGTFTANAARVVVLAILGRLLSPGDFGIVATAMIVLVVVGTVRDLGLGAALVQHRAPTRAHVETAFSVSLLLGALYAGAMALGAPLIGAIFRNPDVVPVVRVIALLLLLRSIGSASTQLCLRDMNFRASMVADVGGYLLGAATSVTLAWLGHGPWSLVWGYLVESLASTVYIVTRYPPPWGFRIHRDALRDLWRYGAGENVATIANVIAIQGDNFVVGRVLGKDPLGLYTRAYELVKFPASTFQSVIGSVLFPGLSRLQDDQAELARAFQRTLFGVAAILLPGSAILIALAPEFMWVLLGAKWGGAVLPFRIMACSMMFRTSYKVGALIARARGDTRSVAMTQILYATLVVGGALFTVRWGIAGVAVTTTIAVAAIAVALIGIGARHTGLGPAAILACHTPGLVTAVVCGALTAAVAHVARDAGAPALVVLAAGALVGGGATAGIGLAWASAGNAQWRWLRDTLREALGRIARRAARA